MSSHYLHPTLSSAPRHAGDGDRGPSPQVRVVLDRHRLVVLGCPIGHAGFDLERSAQRRDPAGIREVNVCVFAEIVLLPDLLERAAVVLEEQPPC